MESVDQCDQKKNIPFEEINNGLIFRLCVLPGFAHNIGALSQLCDARLLPRMEAPSLAALAGCLAHARSLQTSEREGKGAARGNWPLCFHNLHNLFQQGKGQLASLLS